MPKGVASSYEEYFVAACAAWDSLFRAVGNPDTGSGSELSKSLDAAMAAGDIPSAERAAEQIAAELKAGRQQAAVARGWEPRAAMMAQFDRVLAAFEVGTAAKLAVARGDPNAGDPQAAFEGAGGIEAWFAMIEAGRAAGLGAVDSSNRQCANSVTP
jgi:hypothetical protein